MARGLDLRSAGAQINRVQLGLEQIGLGRIRPRRRGR
jgi:hypothetical protein